MTTAISGPTSTASLWPAGPLSSLASRWQALTGFAGSILYATTWRRRATPSGRSIFALRAWPPRTSANASTGARTGWPTPNAGPQNDSDSRWEQRRKECLDRHTNGNGFGLTLGMAVTLAGWPTASARDWKDTPGMAETGTNPDGSIRSRTDQLPRAAQLAGWATPMAGTPATGDRSSAGNTDASRRTEALCGKEVAGHNLTLPEDWSGPARLTVDGQMLTGSDAGMSAGGLLNPEHSRWLLGYPEDWLRCAPGRLSRAPKRSRASATRSSPSLPPPSSC
jgi:hypothetical protein